MIDANLKCHQGCSWFCTTGIKQWQKKEPQKWKDTVPLWLVVREDLRNHVIYNTEKSNDLAWQKRWNAHHWTTCHTESVCVCVWDGADEWCQNEKTDVETNHQPIAKIQSHPTYGWVSIQILHIDSSCYRFPVSTVSNKQNRDSNFFLWGPDSWYFGLGSNLEPHFGSQPNPTRYLEIWESKVAGLK